MTVKFKIGDHVQWISSNSEKRGEVVAAIPAGKFPQNFGFKLGDSACARNHESYVVRGRQTWIFMSVRHWGSAKDYWPRVSLLQLLDKEVPIGPDKKVKK